MAIFNWSGFFLSLSLFLVLKNEKANFKKDRMVYMTSYNNNIAVI